jgi:hypothetical protein
MGSICGRNSNIGWDKDGDGWVTEYKLRDFLRNRVLHDLPYELINIIIGYVGPEPPRVHPLPRTMLNAPPEICGRQKWLAEEPDGQDYFLQRLIGSAIYILYNRQVSGGTPGAVLRSPFLMVWGAVYRGDTYLGMIFPSVEFEDCSLGFGKAQDTNSLHLPRSDCCLVFYDIHAAIARTVDVRHSISKINSLNLANSLHTRPRSLLYDYPVLAVRLPKLVLSQLQDPFERIHQTDLFAPIQDPSWPWNCPKYQPRTIFDRSKI